MNLRPFFALAVVVLIASGIAYVVINADETVNKQNLIDSYALSTATPTEMHTSTPAPTASQTPHLRLTEIHNAVKEAESDIERARLEAEAIRIVADANAYEVRTNGEAQAWAAMVALQPTQTAQALMVAEQSIVGTQQSIDAEMTRLKRAKADIDNSVKVANAKATRESQTSIILIIGVSLAVLGSIAGSMLVTAAYRQRVAQWETPVVPEVEDWQPDFGIGTLSQEERIFFASVMPKLLRNEYTQNQVERMYTGRFRAKEYTGGDANRIVRAVREWYEEKQVAHSPTTRPAANWPATQ